MSSQTRNSTFAVAHFALLNALWISLTVQDTALMTIAVPAAIDALAPSRHVEALAFLAAMSNLAAMLVPPLAGWFSDRHRRVPGGTRRAWVIGGVIVDLAALVAIPFAHGLLAFDLLFVAAVAAENVAIAAYQAMIPEIVPRHAWGAASGVRGAATLIGTVAGLGIAGSITNPWIVFIGTAVLLALGSLTLFGFTEREWEAPERVQVARWHDFIVVFIARSFIFFGLALLMTFVLYFFQDVLHYGNPSAGTAFVGICSLLGAIASSVLLGVLSDRYSRKIITAICGAPMALAAIGFAVAPNPNAMLVSAVFFGFGLGGILSVGWALAIDSLPQLSDVARDLGIWGIATNLPGVLAPLAGGWILHAFGGGREGYQVIFALAGVSFAAGSLSVLRVGARPISSLLTMPVWIAAMGTVFIDTHLRCRIRVWGRIKRRSGATLVLINHQIALDSTTIVSGVGWQASWRHPVFSTTGRRMWEPGFFAVEFPWMRAVMRRVSLGPLFRAIGFMPIENQLSTRTLASFAWSVQQRHGPLALADVVASDVSDRFAPGATTNELWSAANFARGQEPVKITALREPYRTEILNETRERIAADIAAMEALAARGATFFITPEGQFSRNGELSRLRGVLPRLLQHADAVYLGGISYDVFRGKRFSQLVRYVELRDRAHIADELKTARPVTVTQLLASWLYERDGAFTEIEARDAVEQRLRDVPVSLFVDPELRRDPAAVTHEALETMVRQRLLQRDGARYAIAKRAHPRFPLVDDIFAYHARFYAQSVEAVTLSRRSR